MNKWIDELKSYINDEEIISFYIEAASELDSDDYEQLCIEIGVPKVISEYENISDEQVFVTKLEDDLASEVDCDLNLDINIKYARLKINYIEGNEIKVTSDQNAEINSFGDNWNIKYNGKNNLFDLMKKMITFDYKNSKLIPLIEVDVPKNTRLNIEMDHGILNIFKLDSVKINVSTRHTQLWINDVYNSSLLIDRVIHSFVKLTTNSFDSLEIIDAKHSKFDISVNNVNDLNIDNLKHCSMNFVNLLENNIFRMNVVNHCSLRFLNCDISSFNSLYLHHSWVKIILSKVDNFNIIASHSGLNIDGATKIKYPESLSSFYQGPHNHLKWSKFNK